MSLGVSGKTAIVTGAACGLGLAIARHLEAQGANVMCADRNETDLASQIGADTAGLRYFAGDLREKLTVANLLSATVDAFDEVHILVNASRQIRPGDPLDPKECITAELLEQNLMTALRLSRAVARRMIAQAGQEERQQDRQDGINGAIVNIGSIAARHTHTDLMAYSISMAALDQATRSLALALAPHRISVNAVAFGSVMSASLQDALKQDATLRDAICAGTPMGRIADATEIADAVQFLASNAAGFVTGQILTVDGGRSLQDPVMRAAH